MVILPLAKKDNSYYFKVKVFIIKEWCWVCVFILMIASFNTKWMIFVLC